MATRLNAEHLPSVLFLAALSGALEYAPGGGASGLPLFSHGAPWHGAGSLTLLGRSTTAPLSSAVVRRLSARGCSAKAKPELPFGRHVSLAPAVWRSGHSAAAFVLLAGMRRELYPWHGGLGGARDRSCGRSPWYDWQGPWSQPERAKSKNGTRAAAFARSGWWASPRACVCVVLRITALAHEPPCRRSKPGGGDRSKCGLNCYTRARARSLRLIQQDA